MKSNELTDIVRSWRNRLTEDEQRRLALSYADDVSNDWGSDKSVFDRLSVLGFDTSNEVERKRVASRARVGIMHMSNIIRVYGHFDWSMPDVLTRGERAEQLRLEGMTIDDARVILDREYAVQ